MHLSIGSKLITEFEEISFHEMKELSSARILIPINIPAYYIRLPIH